MAKPSECPECGGTEFEPDFEYASDMSLEGETVDRQRGAWHCTECGHVVPNED